MKEFKESQEFEEFKERSQEPESGSQEDPGLAARRAGGEPLYCVAALSFCSKRLPETSTDLPRPNVFEDWFLASGLLSHAGSGDQLGGRNLPVFSGSIGG